MCVPSLTLHAQLRAIPREEGKMGVGTTYPTQSCFPVV